MEGSRCSAAKCPCSGNGTSLACFTFMHAIIMHCGPQRPCIPSNNDSCTNSGTNSVRYCYRGIVGRSGNCNLIDTERQARCTPYSCGCFKSVQRTTRRSGTWPFLLPQLLLKSREFFHRDLLFLVEHLIDSFDLFNLQVC